jgi:hypothetical protein
MSDFAPSKWGRYKSVTENGHMGARIDGYVKKQFLISEGEDG